MTQPTTEEIAGWLREAAECFEMIGEEFVGQKTLSKYAQKVRVRAAQVEAMGWRPIGDKDAPHGIPVLLWKEGWVDEDFNPTGVRFGHFIEGEGYTSCGWNACQDAFTTEDESCPSLWSYLPQPPVKK